MSTECTHGGQCYLAENVPVCCSLCADAFINVTGNAFTIVPPKSDSDVLLVYNC